MKKLIPFFCFIAFYTFTKAQIDPALAAKLQQVLNNRITNGGDHGVSAHLILQNGQTWSGTAGVNGLNQSITDSTVFITASISKLNIALLLLMFQEDGLIDLDDSWHKYLPGLNVAFDTSITIRQLLNHTSGIADYLEVPANAHYVTNNFSTFYTPKYILENIVSGVPDFAPGTNFNYSNSNYCLAAYVAEAATPYSLASELRTRIWNPVGMKHTYLGAYEPIPDRRAGVWWNFNAGAGLSNYSNQSDTAMLSFGYGTDNVVTCPTDLAKLVHALIHNQLLTPQSMNEMLSFVPQSVPQWTAGYGLGIHHLFGQNVDTVLGHNGKFCNNSDVFHSQMCGFTLATMSNTETLWEGIYNEMYNVLRTYFQCNTVPVANFHASARIVCPGTAITFSDSSSNMRPTSWHWNFPGGTLTGGTTVSDSMPIVIYNTPGTYAVSYIASTSSGSDTIIKHAYITVNTNMPAHTSAFIESFETGSLPNSDWSINNSGGSDWSVTSLGSASGTKSVYIDNFTNTAGNRSNFISEPFDVSGFSSPKLTFKMAYQQKIPADNDKLQVSTSINCGGNWVARLTKIGAAMASVTPPSAIPLYPNSNQFITYTVNINNVTGNHNVRFKFEFIADNAAPGNNIYIDDINVFDGAVGINTPESTIGLNVYPNPATEEININCSQIIDELSIINVLGQVCYRLKPNSRKISLTLDKEGLYFITVKSGQLTSTGKLVVKH